MSSSVVLIDIDVHRYRRQVLRWKWLKYSSLRFSRVTPNRWQRYNRKRTSLPTSSKRVSWLTQNVFPLFSVNDNLSLVWRTETWCVQWHTTNSQYRVFWCSFTLVTSRIHFYLLRLEIFIFVRESLT